MLQIWSTPSGLSAILRFPALLPVDWTGSLRGPPDLATDQQQRRVIAIDPSSEAVVFRSERGTFISAANFFATEHSRQTGEDWPTLGELPGVALDAGKSRTQRGCRSESRSGSAGPMQPASPLTRIDD